MKRIARGTESTRAPLADRRNDLYESPPEAVEALLKAEQLPHHIWEPACGPGVIARILRAHGHTVWATDLVNYNSPDQDESGVDFLMERQTRLDTEAIVTNPPFKLAREFVEHALFLVPKVAMLLRLSFLEGTGRSDILDGGKLARVHLFRNRLPMMHREGWDGPRIDQGRICFCWFVWDRFHQGPTTLNRITWK